MKVLICLSAVLAIAHCGPLNALLTSGAAAGPVHPAHGHLVATERVFRNIALEGYSEDDNQDGFVDPIGQVAPVVYAAPAAVAPALTYAHVPAVTHTYPHHVGNLVHTYGHPLGYGFGLPVVAAAAPAAAAPAAAEEAAEDVVDA